MSDDRSIRGPADRARVNVNERYELDYWSERFGVTRDRLKSAVNAVGVMAADVENYLKNK